MEIFGGIDIGGTTIKSGLINEAGEILQFNQTDTNCNNGYDALLLQILDMSKELSKHSKTIGIGFPAVVTPNDGCVHYPPNIPDWGVVPLAEIASEACGKNVVVINDANAAALAESKFGAGKDADNFLYITLGTGVGGGIVVNKNIYTGDCGGAGEIGHIIVDINDAPKDTDEAYRAGTLEDRVGRNGIIASALQIARRYPDSALNFYGESLDVENISQAAAASDPAAEETFKKTGEILGLGIAGALAILGMRLVVIGGGISQSHPLLLDSARKTLKLRALPTIAERAEIRRAHFTKYAGVAGAALAGKIYS